MKAFNEDLMANTVSVCYWNKDDVCVYVAEGLDDPKHVAAFVEYCRLLELKYPEYANHSIGHLYKVISDFYKHMGNDAFIDELSRATPQVLNVILPLINEGILNGYKLGSGWTIVCASNRREDDEGQESIGNALRISAMVPLSEMFGYATSLRSNTQGRGTFIMFFDHYEEVPKSISEDIIKKNGAQ